MSDGGEVINESHCGSESESSMNDRIILLEDRIGALERSLKTATEAADNFLIVLPMMRETSTRIMVVLDAHGQRISRLEALNAGTLR